MIELASDPRAANAAKKSVLAKKLENIFTADLRTR